MKPALVPLALLLAATPSAAQERRGRDHLAHQQAERSVTDLRPEVLIYGGFYSGLFPAVNGVTCVPRTGEIYVSDSSSSAIEIFDENGAPLFAFSDREHLKEPLRVAVDQDDRIYVLDADRTRIKIFSYRGEFIEHLALPGLGPETRPSFTAIAFDRNGDLYVGESRTGQVLAFDRNLRTRVRFGTFGDGPGQFDGIVGIALDEKHVYVASQDGMAIHVFTRQGRFVRAWGFHDAGLHNVSLPAGIAVDSKGRVILLDTLRQEVKYFDSEGRLIDLFAGIGAQPGAVAYPTDLSMDRQGRLCVADGGNRRVQVLAPVEAAAAEPSPEPEEQPAPPPAR
jgi:DNA-binding beta-propeller fold protein YncE